MLISDRLCRNCLTLVAFDNEERCETQGLHLYRTHLPLGRVFGGIILDDSMLECILAKQIRLCCISIYLGSM